MKYLFFNSQFNGDISQWDVSSVKSMRHMFSSSKFNQDISNWNVSNVNDMSFMFFESKFNKNIDDWNICNITDMDDIFKENLIINIPYWAQYKTQEERINAYNRYQLNKKLNNNLQYSENKIFISKI